MAKFLDHVGLTHYTGKLKKLLAGKQDKLVGTPGTVLSFDAQSSPIYVQHWSNPNLFDNWYFKDPINQLGKTEYTGFGISIDRWALNADGKVALNNGIQILKDATQLRYSFDDIQIGAPYTFTLLMTGESTTEGVWAGGVVDDDWVTFVDSMVWYRNGNLLSVFFIVDKELAGSLELGINCTNGNTIVAVKLESGDRQTLARKGTSGHWVLNDQAPNKALELAKCKRYLQVLKGMGDQQNYAPFGLGYCPNENGNFALIYVPIQGEMFKVPEFSYENEFRIMRQDGSVTGITGMALDRISNGCAKLNVYTQDTMPKGAIVSLDGIAAESKLIFSAI